MTYVSFLPTVTSLLFLLSIEVSLTRITCSNPTTDSSHAGAFNANFPTLLNFSTCVALSTYGGDIIRSDHTS